MGRGGRGVTARAERSETLGGGGGWPKGVEGGG